MTMNGAAAAGRSTAAPRPTTKFTRTCGLLRQFIKERGTLGIDIQMKAPPPTTATVAEAPKAHSERNAAPVLLPDLNGSTTGSDSPRPAQKVLSSDAPAVPQASSQLTMFYGGMVFVFDNFPQDKVQQFMAAAAAARSIPPPSTTAGASEDSSIHNRTCAASAVPAPATTVGAARPEVNNPTAGTSALGPRPPRHLPILASGSDLPIARRVSLNRFLEKRKDRINCKAPYQVAGSPDPMASKLQQSTSSGGSPSPSFAAGDPYSAVPSSSKSFPAVESHQAPPPHLHGSHMPDDKAAQGKRFPAAGAGAGAGAEDDDEEPTSDVPWLGLGPSPSKPSPRTTGN